MALVSLADAKSYLRIDTADEDVLINGLLASATRLCYDIARLSDAEIAAVESDATEEDTQELTGNRALLVIAILFTLGYLFEHREEANHVALDDTLRALLFAIREGRG